jgi:flavin reductase (DIM6/NTAB) family NADH-FMN oxidoreductase RutF
LKGKREQTMQWHFEHLTPKERYQCLAQAIIPRPIAWVLTSNGASGDLNLAPYSFFTAICSDPPLVLISAGKKAVGEETGAPKDTRRNILEHKDFVIHLPGTDQINAVQDSAATLAHGDSELTRLGLETVPFDGFSLPRLKACPVALACRLYRLDEIGHAPQAVIYGEVMAMHVDDAILDDEQGIDPLSMDPLARLGGRNYAQLGRLLQPED